MAASKYLPCTETVQLEMKVQLETEAGAAGSGLQARFSVLTCCIVWITDAEALNVTSYCCQLLKPKCPNLSNSVLFLLRELIY